jgi:hypothetical protein
MFPPDWLRFAECGERKYPQAGDVSCRSALIVHRGAAHGSPVSRPVLVLGVDAQGAGHDKLHDLGNAWLLRRAAVGRAQPSRLPGGRGACTDNPKHNIEGLVMGVA